MDTAAVLRDLARAKAAFQLRTIKAIMTESPINDEPPALPAQDLSMSEGSTDNN